VRILLVLLAACGGKPAAKVPANGSASPEPAMPTECTSSVESAKAGNHDRFAFEAPDGTYGYKNAKGLVVIAPRLRYAYEFKPGGIAAAVDNDASFVFIDTTGKVIARAFAYDNGPDYFQEGYARIVDGGKVGFIDEHGRIAIAPRFDEADSFCHGKASVHEGGKELWIDKQGAPTTAPPPEPASGSGE
jgi:hypothetical protein